MGRRRLAADRAGGGARIQALRAKRALTALGAAASFAALASYFAASSSELRQPLVALAVVGGAALTAGLLGRWGALLQLALSLLLVQYLVLLLARDEVDARAPLVGATLIVVAELAYAGLEPPATRRGLARTAIVTLLLAVGAAALGALLLAAASASSGTLVEATVGVVAAAGAIALVAWLAWTSRR